MRKSVVFEGNDKNGYSAYLSEVPGCVAASESLAESKGLFGKVVGFHFELMPEYREEDGEL